MPRFIPIIFVSSTSRDLEQYRQALITTFPSLDVLFRGMEYFGSQPRRPKEVMLDELRGCDLYLGILAHRYGSIDNETGLSFTELEYSEAVRSNIPRIFFLIDPYHPVSPDTLEMDPANKAKLEDFKRRAQADYTTVTFTTHDDLAHKVAQAIHKWTDEHADGWQAMERAARPLSDREREFLDKLTQTDERLVRRAIQALKNLRSWAALEHFYILLRRADTPRSIKDEVLNALSEYKDNSRALDALLAAMKDPEASVRSYAAFFIGERAVANGILTQTTLDYLQQALTDPETPVREEVGHALGKIAIGYEEFTQQCITALTTLQRDPVSAVADRATRSLNNIIKKFPELAVSPEQKGG